MLGSVLSLLGEFPMVLWGESVGGRREARKGRVFLLPGDCCTGQGCSQLQFIPRIFPKD